MLLRVEVNYVDVFQDGLSDTSRFSRPNSRETFLKNQPSILWVCNFPWFSAILSPSLRDHHHSFYSDGIFYILDF